jgi:hypothetical protein
MIPLDLAMKLVCDTTEGLGTTRQQTAIIQRIRSAYSVPNAWHEESIYAHQAVEANELQLFNWNLIEQDENSYQQGGLEYALQNKMQPQ